MEPWQIIALLGAVIVLYAYLLPKPKKNPEPAVTPTQEMEEALELFAEELETENRKLLDAVTEMKKGTEEKLRKVDERLDGLDKEQQAMKRSLQEAAVQSAQSAEAAQQEQAEARDGSGTVYPAPGPFAAKNRKERRDPPAKVTALPNASKQIKERYGELFQMYDRGQSVEAIAKALGMNKGEVQLIIQLARQEDQFRA